MDSPYTSHRMPRGSRVALPRSIRAMPVPGAWSAAADLAKIIVIVAVVTTLVVVAGAFMGAL